MIPASVVALMQGALARTPGPSGDPQGRMATEAKITSFQAPPFLWRRMGARARPISTARLNASRRLQLRPIDQVVYLGPYQKSGLISETASRLDAFSGYPCRT